jgi:hypothetical protein
LLLNDEKTNFNYVRNLLGKKLDHPYFRSVLRLQQDLYGGKVAQAEYELKSNQVVINSEKVLFAWLNSHEYHRDEDKKKFIESLHQLLPLDVSKVSFMKLLIHKAMAAKNLAGLIQVMLGKHQEIAVEVKRPNDSMPTQESGE